MTHYRDDWTDMTHYRDDPIIRLSGVNLLREEARRRAADRRWAFVQAFATGALTAASIITVGYYTFFV